MNMNYEVQSTKKNTRKAFTPTPKVLVRGFTIIEVLVAIFILEV